MTDTAGLDRAIEKANANVADCIMLARSRGASTISLTSGELGVAIDIAQAAVAAKREAEAPTLFTFSEISILFDREYSRGNGREQALKTTSEAILERAALVVDRALAPDGTVIDTQYVRAIVRKALTGKE